MDIESKELESFIKSSIVAIKNGAQGAGFKIRNPIEFNLAVINISEGGGGFKIYVAKAEGKLKSEEISHIKFEAHPERDLTGLSPKTPRLSNPGL